MGEREQELFKALELASRRLGIAASRMDRADTEFGFRVWAEEARAVLLGLRSPQAHSPQDDTMKGIDP